MSNYWCDIGMSVVAEGAGNQDLPFNARLLF